MGVLTPVNSRTTSVTSSCGSVHGRRPVGRGEGPDLDRCPSLLAAAKARGVRLGNPANLTHAAMAKGRVLAVKARKATASNPANPKSMPCVRQESPRCQESRSQRQQATQRLARVQCRTTRRMFPCCRVRSQVSIESTPSFSDGSSASPHTHTVPPTPGQI